MRGLFFKILLLFIYNEKENFLLDENRFSKTYKMTFKDFIIYIIGNRGKTSVLEIDDFFKIRYRDVRKRVAMTISKQNLSQQRMYIDPEFFKQTNAEAIKELYSTKKYVLKKFKDLYCLIIDGSQVKIPNTVQTREEFDVDKNSKKKTKTPKARISVMSDAKNEFILDSVISSLSVGESVLALENIRNAAKIIDLSKAMLIFDRGYVSAELIMELLSHKSYFIFRLKSDTYKKERDKMKSDDEWVEINLDKSRTKNIKDPELKALAEELACFNLRIVNVTLKNGVVETLLTNLPEEIANLAELKNLYGERWQVEKGYDVLKNKLHIENFSGKKRITIEQDFFSQILMYNILIEFKTKCNMELGKNLKYKNYKCVYKVNMNILAGKLKSSLYELFLVPSKEERKIIEEEIYSIAKKNTIKVKNKSSSPRNKNPLASKFPYNNRKNF
jgi:hypothetical protein